MSNREKKSGKVWLVGAGPGDAGLLTIKAMKVIEKADVIVYDALVSLEIIGQISGKAEMIYVGKRSGYHHIPQDEINIILLTEAKKGRRVVRLKGGDPFVFGRGGEELELLVEEEIPFEVVPGVTSAAAVPAYAGIPVTHRDYASSFHVITGHAKKGGAISIDYQSLVKLNGTLIFLMGITAMEEICTGLIGAGMDAATPAAVLEKGTTAAQRSVVSTVGELSAAAHKAKIKTPAIIMVGSVCGLGHQFHWADKRVLGGRQILVTRPRESSSRLAGELRALGAQVIELPAISTVPIIPNERLLAELSVFGTQSDEAWLVFTSPVGVKIFFDRLSEADRDLRDLLCRRAAVKVAAIGSATAAEIRSYGLKADIVPQTYCAMELGKVLAQAAQPGSQVLIVRASEGSLELIPPLEKAGLAVTDAALYDTCSQVHDSLRERLEAACLDGQIDAVTFTSASTVRGFAETMGAIDYRAVHAVCIGEQTAAEAQRYGMDVVIAEQATITSMTDKITEIYGR